MDLIVKFKNNKYVVQITDHANLRLVERAVTVEQIVSIVETGEIRNKPQKQNAYWVFAEIHGRVDNLICISVFVESKNLIIKTVLINWRPK